MDSSSISIPAVPDFEFWTEISKFSDIEIKPNTLVLCDIDDTLLHHPAINMAWVSLINMFFYLKHQQPTETENRTSMEEEVRGYMNEIFRTIPMRHTDREGFFSLLQRSTDFAFVTARSIEAKEFTYSNLRSLDIDVDQYPVHFCGDVPKGKYINSKFDLHKYDYVVFIDDQPSNLESVFLTIFHSGLEVYQFKKVLDVSPYEYYPFPPGFNPGLRFDGERLINVEDDAEGPIDI